MTPPALTPFATLLAARRRDGDQVAFTIPPDWLQGRTSFGGLIAALAVQAMRDVAGAALPLPPLRALQTAFVGPVGEGRMDVRVLLLRAGKSTCQVQATVTQQQGGAPQIAAVLLATFGAGRLNALDPLSMPQPPEARAFDAAPHHDAVERPAFARHFDMRWAAGALPFSGGDGWHTQIHLRLLHAADVPAELLTVLLADAPPTPAAGRLARRAPLSSVTWALELHPLAAPPPLDAPWRIDMETLAAADGYVNQRATLWAPGAQLAALAYQVVAIYG